MTPMLLSALACSTDEPADLGSVHVKSALIEATAGGSIEVTASDDYAPFIGTKLEVPPGALAADTKITIDVYSDSLMDEDADAVGPAVEFGPSGTTFSEPVQVTLPLTEGLDAELARVYVRHGDGTREVLLAEQITVDAANNVLRFSVQHFTTYHPGRARGACRHVTCPSGQTCRGGQCQGAGACTQAECSPAPGAPNYTCPDGTIAGPVCERSAAGVCGWNFINCPGACAPQECGPEPEVPSYTCYDGSLAGPLCQRSTDSACQWVIGTCAGTCQVDANCLPGQTCDNGRCTGSCASDADCEGAEVCLNGLCGARPQCLSDAECASEQICVGGQCERRPECHSDGDCSGQQVCMLGECQAPPECRQDSDCPGSEICSGWRCEPARACASHEACAEGELCSEGRCVEGVSCGATVCAATIGCCNRSCNMCGSVCTQQYCEQPLIPCGTVADCPPAPDGGGPGYWTCASGWCQPLR